MGMSQYDCLVVGSGISGMTMSLLLARAGRRVLLIEKRRAIGGSMRRFSRDGIPFDTGFHFTTGFDGVMTEMLQALDIADVVQAKPFGVHTYLADRKKMIHMPHGRENLSRHLCGLYPGEARQIRQYFRDEERIFQDTPWLHLEGADVFSRGMLSDDDFILLDDYLDRSGVSDEVRCILNSFSMCYGTPPSQVSLASHCRIGYGLHDSISTVRGGGGAFVAGFQREFARWGVEVRANTEIVELLGLEGRKCHQARLSDGTTVVFEDCVMSIHPADILRILPAEAVSAELRRRVAVLEESIGFFSLFARLRPEVDGVKPGLTSFFTGTDFNRIMSPDHPDLALAIIVGEEESAGKHWQTVTAFEVSFPEEVREWEGTTSGCRGESYRRYKAERQGDIERRILEVYPEFEGHLEVLDTASLLTFRDYLSPYGSAYGVRQKLGQSNVFGRLSIRNFYAVGQSAVLPGALGAMLSAFAIGRRLSGPGI
jgi:phytoene dehydrogenase-like protein